MSDETVKDDAPENPDLGPDASKADLKAAADEILKAAKAASPDDEADAEPEAESDEAEPLTMEQQFLALEIEKQEMRDQMLRALAEMENLRKRAEREKSDARTYAIEKFARDLLSVSDNLARALEALPEDEREALTEGGKGLLGGIEMTQKELHTVLTRHGVTAIEVEPGAAFDPNLHQAVANIPSEHPNGTIASLFQAGWRIGDRTLRAAMVAVSAGQAN
ncbi:MAG: nucleotide exchange factor GrpE [Henriciella sp.]|nr:nucleotide exchange factor GrpE [Henriciella sp.]MBO6695938.1 nucleotide exchange factor GrpE [Henriciella sp.]